jgi:uncharacterized protein involved in exopolysaccharide biosynthesis
MTALERRVSPEQLRPASNPRDKAVRHTGERDTRNREANGTPFRDAASLPPASVSATNDALVDLGLILDLTTFVRNACRRRRGLASLVLVAFVVAGVLSVFLLPSKYYVETKLLADRNVVMPLLGNPGRKVPNEADTPTRLAAELILNHDNLQGIVASADLVREAARTRSLAGRIRQRVRALVSKPLTDAEQREEMIWTLRTRMNVQVGDGTVTIGSYWTDPNLAFRIVQAAQQSFLEERQSQELALITGSIAILEKSAVEVGNDITTSLDSLARERIALTPTESRPRLSTSPRARPNVELLAAQSSLDATVRAIADLEQFRSRRLDELQNKLSEQRNTYGAAHPQIENTEQLIRSMLTDSPQLAQLRRDEQQYRAQVTRLGGSPSVSSVPAGDQLLAAAALRSIEGMRSDSIIQEKQQYGRSRLRIAIASYQALLERLDAARMELQTVRATFQFKYGVLIPAAVPRAPVSIKPTIVIGGAVVLGILMAVFSAVAMDVLSGRVLESWQIERALGLPVLGEVSLPRLTS